jgi:hypothetical protein
MEDKLTLTFKNTDFMSIYFNYYTANLLYINLQTKIL